MSQTDYFEREQEKEVGVVVGCVWQKMVIMEARILLFDIKQDL